MFFSTVWLLKQCIKNYEHNFQLEALVLLLSYSLLLLSSPYMVDKILFLRKNIKIQILMDLQILKYTKYINRIFIGWSGCICMYVIVNSIIHKQIRVKLLIGPSKFA